MTNLHIQYFLEVAKLKSFTKASEKLFVAQPSISRQISNLEKELGVSLFDRTKNTIRLTPAGEIMYQFFSDTQNAFNKTLKDAKNCTQIIHGKINVGLPSHFANSQLWNRVYTKFIQNYPNIELELHLFPVRELLEKLNSNDLDIIFCFDSYLKHNKAFNILPVTTIPGYIVFHKNNSLAWQNDLSLKDFSEQILYTLPESVDPYCKKSMLHFCETENFTPRKVCEIVNTETLLFNLSDGNSYTLLSGWSLPLSESDYCKIKVGHDDTLALFWKKNNNNEILDIFANEFQFTAQNSNDQE